MNPKLLFAFTLVTLAIIWTMPASVWKPCLVSVPYVADEIECRHISPNDIAHDGPNAMP